MKEKRLLIIGSGGLRGAYGAGVLVELCKKLGPNYFDTIIASSVGVYNATFYIANQPNSIENIWRNYVDSDKLVDFKNIYQKGKVLDLDYLTSIIKKIGKLNVSKVIKSKVNLQYVLTDFKTGKTTYIKPNKDNIFNAMNASCVIFPLYPPVEINGRKYIDGGLSEPLPFHKEFVTQYDKILIIHNKEQEYKERKMVTALFEKFSHLLPKKFEKLMDNYFQNIELIKRETAKYSNVFLLMPSKKNPLKMLIDTNKKHLNATFNLGIKDAKKAIKFLKK